MTQTALTREQVLAERPGTQLNRWVQEHVLGWIAWAEQRSDYVAVTYQKPGEGEPYRKFYRTPEESRRTLAYCGRESSQKALKKAVRPSRRTNKPSDNGGRIKIFWSVSPNRRIYKMMKCYLTSTADGEHQELVFAEKRSDAIRKCEANQWEEYINVRAVRKPDYDQYAEQRYVPKEVLIQDGWWFECYGYNERGRNCCKTLTAEDNPLVVDDHVYCSQGCLDRLLAPKEGAEQ